MGSTCSPWIGDRADNSGDFADSGPCAPRSLVFSALPLIAFALATAGTEAMMTPFPIPLGQAVAQCTVPAHLLQRFA